ncbi:MAG: lysophospholipid acyltransferase family protein [Campylobacteraceae bacterium]
MFFFRKKHKNIRFTWGKLQQKVIGYKPNIIGAFDKEAKLLIINHQSMLDIVVMEGVLECDTCWCAKKELFEVPVFSYALKFSDMISINRSDKRAIVKLLKDAKDRLEKNRVLAIFPEGTRGDGKNLLKFQQGAKILAEKLDIKVQPVVLNNAKNIFDAKNKKINSGILDISFLPIIDPKDDENWFLNLHSSMQEELNRLQSLHVKN